MAFLLLSPWPLVLGYLLAGVMVILMVRDFVREVRGVSTRVGVPRSSDRHVEVWFGAHVIAAFTGSTEDAAPYEAGMELRFPGLPITNKPVPAVVDSGTADS